MCIISTPDVPEPQPQPKKPPVYMTNPYLDDPANRAIAIGRNALRIDPVGLTGGNQPPVTGGNQPPVPVNPGLGIGLPPPVNPGLGIGLPGRPKYPQYPGYPRLQLL